MPLSPPVLFQRTLLPALLGLGLIVGCGPSESTPEAPASAYSGGDGEASGTPEVEAEIRDEIAGLLADPRVQVALEYALSVQPRSLQDLITLTEIPAPPFMEEVRGRAYAEMLRVAGADSVWTDGEGNVLALLRGTEGRRTVAIDGHLDTVFPMETDVTVQIRGDTLFAPGVGDDTQGLIVVRDVLEAMTQAGLRTRDDILFVGTVGEEGLGDLRGVKYLFGPEGPEIAALISVDGGDETRVMNQGVGSLRYRITFRGPGGHSWGAFGLVNPHNALAATIAHFVPLADAHTSSGPRTSYNIGRIGGGTSVNSIPFESWMEVDMRSLDPASLAVLEGHLKAAVTHGLETENAILRRGAPLTVDVELVGDRPAGTLNPAETPLIRRAVAVIEAQGGSPSIGSGSTNANIPISLGIPAITIGRGGRGGGAHALDEWWLPVDPHLATQNALLILLAEAGLAPSN